MAGCLKAWTKCFRREDAWRSKAHRILFRLWAVGVSLYFSYVLFLAHSPVLTGAWETTTALAWFAAYAGILYLALCWGCQRLMGLGRLQRPALNRRQKLSKGFFALSAGTSLAFLGIALLAAYPGGVTYDIYNQWMQFASGQYNGWHPVFHTLLLGIGGKLTGSYTGVVVLQLIAFSLALAWLLTTLKAWGLSGKRLLVLEILIVTCPLISGGMMGAGKDNAMTLGALLLCGQTVNLYFSRGEWGGKPWNALALGGALAFTTLVRHNGLFYTVPLLICVLLAYPAQRRQLWLSAGAAVVCAGLVMGPLYGSLDIVSPGNTLEESVGLPMTILLDTRAQNPDALDAETQAFLENLMDEETFRKRYVLHSYNSVKFDWPREYISKRPLEGLMGMTLRTMQRNPRGAFETVNAVTDLVWDVTGLNEGTDIAKNSGDLKACPPQNTRINQLGKALQTLVSMPMSLLSISWLFQNIGVQMALLLLCGLWALYRSGPRALAFCLPPLVYNLGTMLLLCGNDARFFQYMMAVSLPACLALLRRPPEEKAGEEPA